MIPILAVLGLVWLQPQDPFVAQRDAAAGRNPQSARFSVAFPDERRTFHPGESIPVIFSYDGLSPTPYNYETQAHLGLADATLDHTDGTVYPLVDYDRAHIYERGGILSGIIGGLIGADGRMIKSPPITFTVFLNQGVRFDTQGHYRLYVTDRHVGFLAWSMRGGSEPPPLVSNILEFDVTSRDSEWEARTAAEAAAVLDSSSDASVRTAAARTLRFLGTDRAVDEMVDRLGRWRDDDKSREDNSQYVRGLFGARNRLRVIARLEATLDDPLASPSWLHLATLAALRLSGTSGRAFTSAQEKAALEACVRRRLGVLHKNGTLADRLTVSFENFAADKPAHRANGTVWSPAIAAFPRDVENALGRLAPPAQRRVLDEGSRNFRDRRFIPMLQRFARAPGGSDGPAEPARELLYQIRSLSPGG